MKRMMLIVNPNAGRSGYRYYFGDAMKVLADGGYQISLFFTTRPGEATEFAAYYAKDYDTVIGYFPMGTTNDIASSLGLPKNDTVAAARRILSGEPHPFDVGGFGEDAYFAYVAAFGAFTEVSYATPQDQKRALGQLAYVLQGAAQLGKIEKIPARIEYDDGVFEGELVYGSMSNSTSVAGIVHFPESMVSLGDGMSELVLLKDPGRVDAYGELAASVISRRFDNENLIILHTRRAAFHFQKPVAWTRDGEEGGKFRDVTLCNHHAPVQLIF